MEFSRELEELEKKAIEEYYAQVRDAEKNYWKEYRAALKIRTAFKMSYFYKKFKHLRHCAITIQRYFRGHKARERFIKRKYIDNQLKLDCYFSAQAVVIQKHFRGYYCRKYVHDFYARKEYMRFLEYKNEEIQKQMQDYYEKTSKEDEERREANARKEFRELARNLHHLSSTKTVPGVYNSPFLPDDAKPSAFGVPVEKHLKTTFKANYTWKAPDRKTIDTFKNTAAPPNKGGRRNIVTAK